MNELPFIAIIQKTFKNELKVKKALYHQAHINQQIAFQKNLVLFFIAGMPQAVRFGRSIRQKFTNRHFWVWFRRHMYTLIAGGWNGLA